MQIPEKIRYDESKDNTILYQFLAIVGLKMSGFPYRPPAVFWLHLADIEIW